MKKLFLLAIAIALMVGCGRGDPSAERSVKLSARRASVQTVFEIPVLKVSFSKPIEKDTPPTLTDITLLLQQKIQEALAAERELRAIDKYNNHLTDIVVYGFKPYSPSQIPIGALAPKWAKFPENVLVVYKVEKKTITAWEKEYEQDILTISETANVSPSQAKTIVSKLKADGYSLYKETVSPDSAVGLVWFRGGWADQYPIKLDWKVTVEGSGINIVKGYDSRGILEVFPVPDGSRVTVSAGYLDLKDEFKPKSIQVEALETEIELLKKELEDVEKKLREGEKVEKRDITKVTRMDVIVGNVTLEYFFVKSAASGVFLGNMKVSKEFEGWHSSWGMESHNILGEYKGVILTNAHVATMAQDFYMMVSKDKEVMYLVFPADSYIRYTQDSDIRGTPAQLLYYDGQPVMSWDYDCAIMVTTAIPQYEQNKAILGDSDRVQEGDPVVMVGNPAYMQKFLTSGVVSNTSYNIIKSTLGEQILKKGLPKEYYNWIVNSSFWFDTPIGIGGTSGSGVWATSGSESGKVIALHNMGLVNRSPDKVGEYEFKTIDSSVFSNTVIEEGPITDVVKNYKDRLFTDIGITKLKEDSLFVELMKGNGMHDIAGMNGGIPINRVKQYLQERGLDPSVFGWKGLDRRYWIK